MGCVQAKGVPAKRVPPSYPPRQGRDSFKPRNGYATGGGGRRPLPQKQPAAATASKLRTKSSGVDDARNIIVGGVNGVSDGGKLAERKLISREGESHGVVGNKSRRIAAKKIAAEELVGGWPKWLVDNIPEDVLVALVPKSADSYDKLAKVGQGTYSNVYKARDRETGKIVALKKVRFDTSEPESVKFMAREIVILQKLDHPNIIKLEGLATSRMQYSLYLVFDFMQSDLARLVSRPGRLTEPQVKCYMQQLLSGLHHCHERGILHRDIKGSNLLIDKNGMLKIADFGLANFFQPRQKRPLTNRVVTLWYRAPELLLGATDYGVGIDLWSAGCLLAEMFVGKPIMPGRTEVEQLHRIFKLCGSPSDDYWKIIKPPTTFRPPQQYKPSFQENLASLPSSSFILLTTLLALEPANRGTAASALQNEFFSSSPLACDLSGLPAMSKEEDEPIPINDRRKKMTNKKQRSQKINGSQGRRNSISVQAKEDSGSFKKEGKNAEGSMQSQEMGNNSISSSASSAKPFTSSRTTTTSSSYNQSEASSPSSYQRPLLHHSQSAKTEAHPNALKNIKNFPILLASLAESGKHIKLPTTAYAPGRRSVSTVEFKTIDLDKISKLFGVDDD